MSKPWDNESTPLVDAVWTSDKPDEEAVNAVCEFAEEFERRMRAAERLLEDERREAVGMQFDLWCREADAHLEAARKEENHEC